MKPIVNVMDYHRRRSALEHRYNRQRDQLLDGLTKLQANCPTGHKKTRFMQDASGNDSWRECVECGKAL